MLHRIGKLGAVAFVCVVAAAHAAPVAVPDPNLEAALEQAMGLPVNIDGVIDGANFAGLNEFRARNKGIIDLTGLEAATDLVTLDLRANGVVSVMALQGLTSLETLDLGFNDVVDVSPLAGLTNLISLELGSGNPLVEETEGFDPFAVTNAIVDISSLGGLTKLEYLNLVGNVGLTSIAVISSMTSLSQLWVAGALTDFTPLASRADTLTLLAIGTTGNLTNADVPILNTLTNLFAFAVFGEPGLTDLSGFTAINPEFFIMGATGVTSLAFLANYPNLSMLFAPWGVFTSLDGIEGLQNLVEVGVEGGQVSDIDAVSGMASIQRLVLADNQISDISALATMPNLNGLDLANNFVTDLQPLLDNEHLGGNGQIDLRGNPLTETAICEQLPILRARYMSPFQVSFDQTCGPSATLTVNVVGVGNVFPNSGTILSPLGETVSVSAFPLANSGYAYNQTTGAVNTTDNFLSILMDEDKSITVEFINTGPLRTLTMIKAGDGQGFLSPGTGVLSFIEGRSANLFANLPNGSYFGGWSGDLTSFNISETVVMDSNKVITGTITTTGFNVTIATTGLGFTSPATGTYPYSAGLTLPIEAFESVGIRFLGWTGPVADPESLATTVTVTEEMTITANFVTGDYTLTISTIGDGTTLPSPGDSYFFEGASAFLQAISAPATAFLRWSGDIGDVDPFIPAITVIMNQNRAITAEFVPADFFLTVSVIGGGNTTPAPGVYGFRAGQTAFLGAIQMGDEVFSRWTGDLGSADPQNLNLMLVMNQDRAITAEFFTADFYLTIAPPVEGGSTQPPAGSYGFIGGTNAIVRPRPAAGFRFAGWQGDFESAFPTAVILMDADKTVTPIFEEFPESPIVFGSANFEQVIRQHLSKPSGPIFPSDIGDLVQVQAGNSSVNNLQGLEFFNRISRFNGYSNPLSNIVQVSGLTMLMASDIASCQVTDISPYNYLPYLEDLNFGANLVSDLSGLTVLPSLRRFVAFENDIADISTLANFRTLRELNLNDNQVTDLSPLAGLINLERLRMLNNDVQSVAPLANLLNLRTLALAGSTSLSDISALAGLTQLQELDLSRCAVSDISALQTLPSLNFVSLINNQVADLTPLVNNPSFGMDDQLFISGNPLSQAAACEQALELEARGVLVIGAVCDQEAPIITRNGQAVVAVALQSIYADAGAAAFDNQEGNLTGDIVVTNPVNTFVAGTYIVRYNVMDSLGNTAAEVTRTVHVVPSEILLPFQLQLLISGFNSADANQDGKLGLAELQARIPGITQNDLGARDLDLSGGLELAELVLATYPGPVHTGDRDADGRFILSEVLRLVQFYNSGGHHCAPGTEDGYAPGPGSTACLRHAADVLPNFIINLTELLRVIQLFNSGGYAACPAQQTEDGYCPS